MLSATVSLLFAFLGLVPSKTSGEDLVGTWEGRIQAGGSSIRTVLHLEHDVDGALVGTVDSPEQNAFGIGLAEVEFDGEALSLEVPATHASWSGTRVLEGDREQLVGTWKQRGAELKLDFDRMPTDPRVGPWTATLLAEGMQIRLVLHVGTREDGSYGASMVALDPSPTPVPVISFELGEHGALHLELPEGAVYDGAWNEAEHSWQGPLTDGEEEVSLVWKKSSPPVKAKRPQTPQSPFPYLSEEVLYTNPAGGNQLAGTLTRPKEGGPFPAVLLITGSGAQDRDETLFEHKPFLVIADRLTRRGVAVLRVDDRGVGGSTGSMATATSADFATDVHAGIDYLASRDDIDAEQIGLLGHSEGGLIAPMVASERSDVAFLVLLAGPGTTGAQILLRQAALINEAMGASAEAVEANREAQELMFGILRQEDDVDVARQRLREAIVAWSKERGEAMDAGSAEAQIAQVSSPWFRFFLRFDPAPVLCEVTAPVLALNGALDLQVPATENLAAIRSALEEGGNDDVTAIEFPGLNHLFQHCKIGTPSEYAEIEETMSAEVLQIIGDWIVERVSISR